MFELIDQHGKYALMHDGSRFKYSSRELARVAARILGPVKGDDSGRFFKVVPA